MKTSRHQNVARRKRRIERRLRPRTWTAQATPMYRASNIQYEHGDRVRGLASGGIGAMHRLAHHTGVVDAIDRHVQVLKVHLPYHESDHVLGIASNVLCGGSGLQDIEQRRQDEVYLDALGTQRIPDPTTAGDFCRRFDEAAIEALQTAINETRVRVWRTQPAEFFDEAVIDADGTLAETTGQCKEGMDIAYDGVWGYHPLVVSLANTREPLFLINRSGNRPSAEGAAERFDQARTLCRDAGFQRITFRGDTDFSQTQHLDRWDGEAVRFLFGYDASGGLIRRAEALPEAGWTPLVRRPAYEVQTEPRTRPVNVKAATIVEPEFRTCGSRPKPSPSFRTTPRRVRRPIAWWWSARTSRWSEASTGSSTRFATSSTSPMTARPRPRRWSSWRMIAATRRTSSTNSSTGSVRRGCRSTRCSATGRTW